MFHRIAAFRNETSNEDRDLDCQVNFATFIGQASN